ncbi:DNA polymerase III polC-type [Metamycoplasma arthritidis]|uniref:DNA polymerase III PolC-type n=1 Tax=Metamycoplasma arthritidis (strain 158L3-1) TaxID=243272 RepID=B3PN84_META1|nr:PolC-type DNA polymerase III [Metamycoplasma arthritidis]ACF07486.1 DNA polymerase III subunit alpha [Metamycoplasma arthritidis 158L3-1]VEU79007.1 DNA polymerase III polC-type [Metamycoplasma arthritidis]
MKNEFDETFLKLCKEIKFELNDEFRGTSFKEAKLNKSTHKWTFDIIFPHHISIDNFKDFKTHLDKRFPNNNFSFSVRSLIRDKSTIIDYLHYVFLCDHSPLLAYKNFFNMDLVSLEGDDFILILPNQETYDGLKKLENNLKESLENIGFGFYKIKLKIIEEDTKKRRAKKIEAVVENFDKFKKEEANNTPSSTSNQPYRRSKAKAIEMDIKSALNSYADLITLKGEVFSIDVRKFSSGKSMASFGLSDYNEAIIIKVLLEDNEELKITNGETVIVTGKLTDDQYSKTKIVFCGSTKNIIVTEGLQRLSDDNEENKRIEFALRSNMSTQDGISSPSAYLKAAKHFGHRAIAITDLDDVQSFPEFYNATKKDKSVVPIYGATISSISSDNGFFYGTPADFDLSSQTYVVFDLETTGLSPRFNEIIEFGASIIENGIIKESHQFFIKPTKPIPPSITEITKITDNTVANGYSQEEGVRKIYDILKNRICVAHNAKFDINVCKENFLKYGLDNSKIIGIDSLAIARFLIDEAKSYRLEIVAKKFNVYYARNEAHRADYDANVLANVWILMILKLAREKNIRTANELAAVNDDKLFAKKFPREVRVIAKNQKGLKKLFKIISKSLTDDYHGGPRLFIDKWEHDEDLLLGTSTNAGWVWEEAMTGTDENILKALAPYDYIEFPPISTFNYIYKDDSITLEQVQFAYKDLLEKAKKLGKLCIAVSDARYIYDYQSLIYRIYVNAPTLGGGQHWLKKYREIATPDFKYLTTRQMKDEFKFLNDGTLINEIVVDNTHKLAEQITPKIEVIKDKLYFPTFDDSANKLKEVVYQTAKERYGNNIDEKILSRIEKELGPITKYGYSVIYWISHKLVKRSNQDGYLVGSRGSVGSSIVANLAGITEVNPLKPHYLCEKCKHFEWSEDPHIFSGWDLPDKKCPKCATIMLKDGHDIPFETFLGFEANKVPDIDLNFSGEYQVTIHNYVKELFGEAHTFRAGTIATIASKTAYGFCRKYDEEIHSLHEEPWTRTFLDFLASKTEGVKRTTGQHPGGIIIIPKEFDVEDFTPVNYPANDITSAWKTTHFDFTSIHDNVLKLDLLGHDDPTVIRMLEDLTKTDAKKIPKFDEKVMSLFSSTEAIKINPSEISNETTGAYGLPEFGTTFVRRMLKTAKPKSFNDLILMSGLSHGTDVWSGNAEELIKQGKKLQDCVCCRDDIMRDLINWNIDHLEAFEIMEKVRKGKGLSEYQESLLQSKNVPIWYIESLKKIKYMFPKAHATAYVIMAWRIAWYKFYYPLQFYASFYSTRPDAIDIKVMSDGKDAVDNKLLELKKRSDSKKEPLSTKETNLIPILEITQELYARGFKITNVHISKSKAARWIVDIENKALIPPFVVVEGLGETVADSIIQARNEHEFLSVEDFEKRTKVNSKIASQLKLLGILDELDETNQNSLF